MVRGFAEFLAPLSPFRLSFHRHVFLYLQHHYMVLQTAILYIMHLMLGHLFLLLSPTRARSAVDRCHATDDEHPYL